MNIKGFAAALSGDKIDQDALIDREVLLHGVQKKIFSDMSGQVLDIRDAVMLKFVFTDTSPVIQLVTGAEYDELMQLNRVQGVLDTYTGATVEVIDGRWYTADGMLRVNERKRREQLANN